MSNTAPPGKKRDAASVVRLLNNAVIFSLLEEPLLVSLAQAATFRTYARGERLWAQGAEASFFTIIVSGIVKIVRPAREGDESIIGLFGPGESVGEIAVLGPGRFPADAVVASEKAEVLRIEAAPVQARLASDVKLAASVNRACLAHGQALFDKIKIMSAGSVPRRLATLLLHLADRFGDELEGGEITIPLPLRRSELAHLVGATVETTIRAVRKWERDGALETTKNGFVLRSLDELRAVAKG